MRLALLPALGLLLLPAAQACSLAYQPFSQASWEGGPLRYVEASRLVEVDGGAEKELTGGYAFTFADSGEGVLVAGQDGLGSDCGGRTWLRRLVDGSVAWERSGFERGAVYAHADGPFVALDGKWLRWTGGDLEETGWLLPPPRDGYAIGVSADGAPVSRSGESVVVGRHAVPVPSPGMVAIAHNATLTAVASSGPDGARLTLVAPDGSLSGVSWEARQDLADVAWVETAGWAVAAGGRAFLVRGGLVTDLGVDAVAVAARGPQAVAFQQDGYTVFAGTRAAERWTRSPEGAWSAGAPEASPSHPVEATLSAGTARTVSAPPAKGSPATPFAGLAAAVALAALARRRGPSGPSFEG